jgi:hypothetical protein
VPKSPYTTPEARAIRDQALSKLAKKQMLAQWEQQRKESGNALGYYGCHRRVRKTRGRAGDLTCVDCEKQARHWAHIHGTDPTDPQNYQPMCQSCHWAYDDVGARAAKTRGPEGSRAIALKAWETKRRKNPGGQNDPRDSGLARGH